MDVPRRPLRFPKSTNDRVAFSVFVLGPHLYLWYEMFIVLPFYHKEYSALVYWHYMVAVIIYINCFGNLYRMITTNIAMETGLPPTDQPNKDETWKHCPECYTYSPPRSHHCKLCNICVLKRDHHCWFAGYCVGFWNHRFYLMTILYAWIAAVYGNLFNWSFVIHEMGGYSIGTFFCLGFPHMAFAIGSLSLYELFVAAMTFLGYFFTAMLTWLIQVQVTQIQRGQTKYERKVNIRVYDKGWRYTVREVLGERWYLVWLCPWLSSPILGDGSIFESQKDK